MVMCLCTPLWTGTLCTQRIDPCVASNPCLNSGICIATYNGINQTIILCQCLAAYTGKNHPVFYFIKYRLSLEHFF